MNSIMADEFIDILYKTGEPTGDIKLKSEAHQLGLYHASVHIWFFTDKGEVLLQKRASNKDTYPDLWDISVAGHISAGETAQNSAIREIKEEIGIYVSTNDLKYIHTYLSEKKPKAGFYDNEFNHIYLSKLRVPITSLTLQKEEVSDITLIPIEELILALQNPNYSKTYVPHAKDYYNLVLKEITNQF
ncbi:NUDIX hydrolase [Aquimarina aquimarini]|uniref:NUDIX hydrolase n=1 Tax=Aquimarina aquimarini TaxID=1191734 RepID=UPI001F492749|nr:NUDIX domain-containing protein [Aquimarina aquimarini]